MDTIKTLALVVMTVAASMAFVADSEGQVGSSTGIVNPNLAGETELLALPSIHQALVTQIVDQRPFLSMVDLHAVLSQSLDENQLTDLYATLFVPINLNTASRDEILLVPGVGPRIAHEFEEYRPYRALAQFHREIGKYVDDDELARLAQFVFVPINLNTASDDDILSIPGVGPRLLHEFKEYRPYRRIEQFRREIGKYVSSDDVARLERYVTLDER